MSSTDRLSNAFLNTLNENMLQNVCLSPTRGNNILDLIITGNPYIIYSVEIEEPLANRDHNSVRIKMRFPVKRVNEYSRTIILYVYSKGDYENMNEELDQISLNKYDPQQRHGHKLETFQRSVSNLDRQIRPKKGD